MGWLDDRTIEYLYFNGKQYIILEAKASEDRPAPPPGFKYKGMVPYKMNLMTKVQFEQNGRIGYRIDVGDGKQIYRSATREKFEHQVGNMGAQQFKKEKEQGLKSERLSESAYTKAYAEKVKESKRKTTEMHKRNLKKILSGGKV